MFLLKKAIFILAVTGTFLLFGKSAPWDGDAFDWNTVPEQYPGIRHKSYSADVPRPNKINIVRIDLKTPGLKFAVTPKDENHGKPMPDCPRFNIATKREMTRDFMLKHRNAGRNMILAANTAPWSPWEHPHTHIYAANMGLLISDGVQVDCINKKYYRPVFFETKDGAYGMKTFKPGDDYSHVKNAVSGFFFDLFEGNVIQQQHRLMPCCSFGLDKECRYLYIIIVDGRQKGFSEGATAIEMGKFLKKLGAYNGIYMDGGGSATLTVWDPDSKFTGFQKTHESGAHTLNHQPRAKERLVGCNVGFYYEK